MSQVCVLVLSSPRSGSSCTTGCLYHCGVSLGVNHNTKTKNKFNEKGYFENTTIYHYNRDLLQYIKHNVFDTTKITEEKRQRARNRQKQLSELIKQQFANEAVFAVKDPRILFVLPMWLDVLIELHITIKILLLYRDLESTVKSLINFGFRGGRKKDKRIDDAHEVVSRYKELMKEALGTYDCKELHFENLINNTIEVVSDLCDWIGVDFTPTKQAKVLDFVDPELQHYSPL